MNYNTFLNLSYPQQQANNSWQQWPKSGPNCDLPQPPFMPPNVVGTLQNTWTPSPPALISPPHPVPLSCESFPYDPQNYRYKWRQYDEIQSIDDYSKKPRMENFIDYCDVCDRGFKTEEKKRQHYSEHTTCSEPGCSFEAHYKIVDIHKRNLHGPNGFRIKLDTPEDIQKWREERRKNFPTEKRIEEKKLQKAEKKASGAVLQEQSFGKFGRFRGRGRNSRRERGGKFHNRRNRSSDQGHNNTTTDNKGEGDQRKEFNTPADANTSVDPLINCDVSSLTSLSQLVSNYQSDDDDDEKNDDAKAASQEKNTSAINKKNKENEKFQDNPKQDRSHLLKNEKKRSYKPSPSRPSLLRMLLEPEIRRERNDILQCVRFIVEKNFFDAPAS